MAQKYDIYDPAEGQESIVFPLLFLLIQGMYPDCEPVGEIMNKYAIIFFNTGSKLLLFFQ